MHLSPVRVILVFVLWVTMLVCVGPGEAFADYVCGKKGYWVCTFQWGAGTYFRSMLNTKFECGGGFCDDRSHSQPDSWVDIAGGISQSCEDHSQSFKGWTGDEASEWDGCTTRYQESHGFANIAGVNQDASWWPTPGGTMDVWDEDLCVANTGPDPARPPYAWYSGPWSTTISGAFASVYDLDYCIHKQLIGTIYWPGFTVMPTVVKDEREYKRVELRGSAPVSCSRPEKFCEADAVCSDLEVLGVQECRWYWREPTTRCDQDCQGYDFTPRVTSVNGASYDRWAVAPASIASGFGTRLATTTQGATTLPLPTMLGGTRVNVLDSAGTWRPAPLFFVSPEQVNYLMPEGTVPGPARIVVLSDDGPVSKGNVLINSVAPGLFTANAGGTGVAAGSAVRVKADGSQTYEPISRFDETSRAFVAVSIDLGPETDQVFLVLFGTGTRGRTSLSAVTAMIADVSAQVEYAGPSGEYVGLDQINIRLPRTLRGRGEVDILLTVEGHEANRVAVSIK